MYPHRHIRRDRAGCRPVKVRGRRARFDLVVRRSMTSVRASVRLVACLLALGLPAWGGNRPAASAGDSFGRPHPNPVRDPYSGGLFPTPVTDPANPPVDAGIVDAGETPDAPAPTDGGEPPD